MKKLLLLSLMVATGWAIKCHQCQDPDHPHGRVVNFAPSVNGSPSKIGACSGPPGSTNFEVECTNTDWCKVDRRKLQTGNYAVVKDCGNIPVFNAKQLVELGGAKESKPGSGKWCTEEGPDHPAGEGRTCACTRDYCNSDVLPAEPRSPTTQLPVSSATQFPLSVLKVFVAILVVLTL